METSELIHKTVGWIVTILTPFALVLTAVRLLLTPAWVRLEYRMPGFPPDPYGFTIDDRLHWSLISLDYLRNDEAIDWLAEQRFDTGTPIYNERELQHMADVKNVVGSVLAVWLLSLGLILLAAAVARWGGWFGDVKLGLLRGGWLTLGFVGVVMVFVVVAFGGFFTYFHEVFFDPGTWTFSFSDTLIRLFPMRFWQDGFLWIGGISVLTSLWLISLTRR